jgi:hypothetical protein
MEGMTDVLVADWADGTEVGLLPFLAAVRLPLRISFIGLPEYGTLISMAES